MTQNINRPKAENVPRMDIHQRKYTGGHYGDKMMVHIASG